MSAPLPIVKRLTAPAYWMSGSSDGHEGENTAPREAAALITELYEALDEALDAMRPLAHYYEINDQRNGNLEVPVRELANVLKATRLAKTALAKANPSSSSNPGEANG